MEVPGAGVGRGEICVNMAMAMRYRPLCGAYPFVGYCVVVLISIELLSQKLSASTQAEAPIFALSASERRIVAGPLLALSAYMYCGDWYLPPLGGAGARACACVGLCDTIVSPSRETT